MPRIPGLTHAEADAYAAAISAPGAETFRRATRMNLDHDHNSWRSLTGILSGQVRWSPRSDVWTQASLTLSDFDDEIDLDPRHLVRIEMGVDTADYGVLWAPLITGWVQECNDTGYTTEVVLDGKEAFGLRDTRRGRAKRGERVGEVIWRMHHKIGERHIVIPDHLRESGPKLAGPVEWGGGKPEKSVTVMSRRLAKRAGLQVYHDQLGRLDLRPIPDHPAVSFVETRREEDAEVALLEPIQWAESWRELCNRVIGAGRRSLRSVAIARGIFAPGDGGLVRGGVPLRLDHRFSDETQDSQGEIEDVTRRMLDRLSKARSRVAITSTPAPWLLPVDKVRAEKRSGRNATFWLNEGSLELDGSRMAIGYTYVSERAGGRRVHTSGRGYTDKERREMRRERRERRERRH